ncbi:MAG: SUMF1/EgtB/PvdO family nonheme iron enzyme [Ferruginibacter sp.]
MNKKLLSLITFLLITISTFANDVLVSTVSLTGQTTGGAQNTHFVNVQFNISWKNSWRTSTNESNYDGCWLFVKYRKQSTSVWLHASLNVTGQTTPVGSVLQPSLDGKGAWIFRNANGIGDVAYNSAQLRWNYGADGVLDNENVEIQVYAVEMVNIPQSPYNLGNASTEIYKFRDGLVDTWFPVSSEAAINCGTTAGNLYSASNFLNSGTIPAPFPKGYNAFWVMKYEFSKQQYLDFLNTLDQTNATGNNIIGATGNVPNMIVTQPERAATGFSGQNVLAWLDWAAMRPMTELEYEKASRGGNNAVVPMEFAWGNTSISAINTPSNLGTTSETWASGNANYSGGPNNAMRCGALATASSTRTSSGATFYGVMEMSGNVREMVINAGSAGGRTFTGLHGDGVLNATAESNTAFWPSSINTASLTARGGGFNDAFAQLQICDRSSGAINYTTVSGTNGGRGVRTGE